MRPLILNFKIGLLISISLILLSGCATSIPKSTLKDAIRSDSNVYLIKNGFSNFIYNDTKVDSYEVVDSFKKEFNGEEFRIIKYKAQVSAYDREAEKYTEMKTNGTLAFIEKRGKWYYENIR